MFKLAEQLRAISDDSLEKKEVAQAQPHVEAIINMLDDASNDGLHKAIYISDIPDRVSIALESSGYSLTGIRYTLDDEENYDTGVLIDWRGDIKARGVTETIAYCFGSVDGHQKVETGITYEVI